MNKTISILKFIIYNSIWILGFWLQTIILYPILIYPLRKVIRKYQRLMFPLWLFLNDGRDNETFIIADGDVDVACDWYLTTHGNFNIGDKLTSFQKWWWSYKWHVRNFGDNFLNFVIGFDGSKLTWINNVWFTQNNDLRFLWKYENKWISIALGSNEYRYASHIQIKK